MSVPAWGKYESPGRYHRLEHHCADVAACFEVLLREPVVRARFARAAGEGGLCGVMEGRLAVIAFLHDFAKLNAGFQFKVRDPLELPPDRPPKMGHIGEAFFCVEQAEICEALGFPQMVDAWGPGLEQRRPLLSSWRLRRRRRIGPRRSCGRERRRARLGRYRQCGKNIARRNRR